MRLRFFARKGVCGRIFVGIVKRNGKVSDKSKSRVETAERPERRNRQNYPKTLRRRITDERFDFLVKSYEDEEKELKNQAQDLKQSLVSSEQDEEKLFKFIKIVKTYSEIWELTPEILNSFVEKIIISETEWYAGRKIQEVKIIYKFVGAIQLPQYDMS